MVIRILMTIEPVMKKNPPKSRKMTINGKFEFRVIFLMKEI